MLLSGKQILPVTLNAGSVGVTSGDDVGLGFGEAVTEGVISGSGEDVFVGNGSVDVSCGASIVSAMMVARVMSSRSIISGVGPSQAEIRNANISNHTLHDKIPGPDIRLRKLVR